MRALLCTEFASYQTQKIQDTPSPKIKKNHVRIAIKAAGVNFPDMLMIEGRYQIKPPLPFIAGAECAGIITEIGENVTDYKCGDRVACLAGTGCFAQEIVAPLHSLAPIPKTMSFEDAAGFIMVYATTYHALVQRAALKAGETLLVLGAAGGVGLAAVQIGKALGATVIACASNDEKLAICKANKADAVINYSHEDIKTRARELADGGVDVVYDPIGGKFAEPAVRALNWGGRYLVIGFAAGDIPRVPFNLMLLKSIDIRGVHWGAWLAREPHTHQANMQDLLKMYGQGDIKPHIGGVYNLDDFTDAFDVIAKRQAVGKLIICPP